MSAFFDLDAYVRLPRVGGLWMSPDGRRLVVGVATPDGKNTRYRTALWEVDPGGKRPARRLTRSSKGEAAAAFTPGGDLLFLSSRPGPEGDEDDDSPAALWLQPVGGGDSRVIAAPAGGFGGVVVGRDGTLVASSGLLPAAADADADKELRKERKEAGVSAMLHEGGPVRYWDHDLGPARARLLGGRLGADDDELELRDLTGPVGGALGVEPDFDVSPDGRTVVASWRIPERAGSSRTALVAIDVATGERRTLAEDPAYDYGSPQISPDGTQVAFVASRRSTAGDPGDNRLALVPVGGGAIREPAADWDRWPDGSGRWTPDGAALIVPANERGRTPLWRVDVATGEASRLTGDDGAYTDVWVSPDGQWVYALRAAVDSPPVPVRVAVDGSREADQLRGPVSSPPVPGKLEEISAEAADGSVIRAWLALPAEADGPAPLLLWIHGGPLMSWQSWSWRWNPWVAVAHGYAVLLPDPALSTGYGREFVMRGWGDWGGAPYTDLMTITDAAVRRPDIDAERTAAMGGSFGGYMSNWIAGHTDRFQAIVTHASLWALDQFLVTTDVPDYWSRELTAQRLEDNSPQRSADAITTPMLVIHGDKDYRVPIGEALRLWWDLQSRSKADDGSSPHKFLYFPDENHWILKPGNAKIWYETVLAFLAHHVRGEEWQRPHLLG
ncbi:prolyl oligopeptidase family serine peptidase [Actinoplanes sp. NPDC051343]|uniref:S9 family peptidase n=1 Tax=Actinoplanes sp. NPDC051343 TaxID=3363906 RepID=UPI0037A49AEA